VSNHVLVPHPGTSATAVRAVVARVECSASVLRFEYRLTGDLGALAIPRRAPRAQRRDRLWEHSCFEAFVAPVAGEAYCELNFSPSTDWGAYAFDRYRDGMRPLPLAEAPQIAVVETANELSVTASVELDGLSDARSSRRVGLTAVVEDRAGRRAYFALLHPRDAPDFHDAAGFSLLLAGSSR
jgi:hypothetical protein